MLASVKDSNMVLQKAVFFTAPHRLSNGVNFVRRSVIHLELWVKFKTKFKSPTETTILWSNNLLMNNKQYL